ncbi:hypothetical protein [Nonomuraea sp. NPDC052265]|uniref:hypothetical protein n=1 Tax=Nonomuraea sp. NPDC052265 TaxID=3364374 RepID=UPI0037C628DC
MESSYRKNAASRRQACEDLADLYEAGMLREIRAWVEATGIGLGRTRLWVDSCRFLIDNFDVADTTEDPNHYRDWAILQGIIYMNMHAK